MASEETRSHQQCWTGTEYAHVCQVASGRRCYEQPCDEPAGTWWGPYWCPTHDVERLDRISAGLSAIAAHLSVPGSSGEAQAEVARLRC